MSEFAGAIGELASKAGRAISRSAERWFGPVNESLATSGARQLEDLGPSGSALNKGLQAFRDSSEQKYGQFAAQYAKDVEPLKSNPKLAQEYLNHYIRGAQASPYVQQVVAKHRLARLDLWDKAGKAGIKVAPLIQDDYPHVFPRWLYEGENRERAIQHLIKGGDAKTTAEAERILDRTRISNLKSYNLEAKRRYNLPGFREDLAVIPDVMRSGYRRLAFAETLGPNRENLDTMLEAIKLERGNIGYQKAKKVVDVYMRSQGVNYVPPGKLEQSVASLQVFTKLGLAVLSHLGQPINLMLYDGSVRPFAQGLRDMVSDYGNAHEFAMKAGSILGDTLEEIRERAGSEVGTAGRKVLQYSGFTKIDDIRRTLASNVGRHIADELLERLRNDPGDRFVRGRLSQLGVDAGEALERGSLTESDYLIAAKRTSDITQFRYDALSVPPAWRDSPAMRMMTMFKQFYFVQTKFLKDFVLRPAYDFAKSGGQEGSLKPLILMSIAFPTVGEIVADLKKYAREGDLTSRPGADILADRLLDNFAQAGGLGVLHDVVYAMSSPDQTPAWHFFAGPIMSDLVDISSLPFSRRPMAALGKNVVRRVPFIGPLASKKLFPSKKKYKTWLEKGGVTKAFNEAMESLPDF
jgi:hypothetical protein